MHRFGTLSALAALVVAGASSSNAQSLPTYVPINPVTTSRSALYFQSMVGPAPTWRATAQFDWSSLIEIAASDPTTPFLLDAEVLRLNLTLVRDYGPANFVLVSAEVNSAIAGVMDGFYNWYHDVTGLRVAAREQRPSNEFAYRGRFKDGVEREWNDSPISLGDLKLGAGVRNSPSVQTLLYVTLPTSTAGRGYSRGVVTGNATITGFRNFSERLRYEGSVGLGWAPRHGELEEFQKTIFWALSSGLSLRFWGNQSMFFNGFYQTAGYRDTGVEGYDRAEMTGDMGFLIRPSPTGPVLILALTEDLKPSGSAVDATFRIGLRW
ncbi:MAG: DUF3187 family protein [Gemmatimonadota bacterium]|nr:DUF3187 family protein [Gemmatimonadota bacterium]